MFVVLAAAAVLSSTFAPFEGHWRCHGRFIASGRPIASELTMRTDPASGVFVVRHDDTAPMSYHSVELWTLDPGGGALHAAVTDRDGGLRVFRSPVTANGTVTFSRPENGSPQELFRYAVGRSGELTVEWSVARPGQPLRVGDTLACTREES